MLTIVPISRAKYHSSRTCWTFQPDLPDISAGLTKKRVRPSRNTKKIQISDLDEKSKFFKLTNLIPAISLAE